MPSTIFCKRLPKAPSTDFPGFSAPHPYVSRLIWPTARWLRQTLAEKKPTLLRTSGVALRIVALATVAFAQDPRALYTEAAEKIRAGQPEQAVALLEPHVRNHSGDLRARTLLGMALSASGRLAEANANFEEILRVNRDYAPAIQALALNQIAMGRTAEARRNLEQLLRINPHNAVGHLAMADLAYAVKDFPAAATHYEKSGALVRADPRRVLNYAGALLEVKQPEAAKALLRDLPAAAGAAIHFEAGILLARLGDLRAAAAQFERARSAGYPDRYEVEYNLALAYHKGGQPAQAVRVLEALIRAGTGKAETYNLLGHAYRSQGLMHQAYEAFRQGAERDPLDEANYLDLIALCLDQNNPELASEIADIGLRRLPESPRLWIQKGVVYAWKGLLSQAKEAFTMAARRSPQAGLAHVALGLVLVQMNEIQEAIRLLRERAAQNDYLAQWFLAEALYRSGAPPGSAEETEAIAALEQSVRNKPDLASSRVLLGKLWFRRGDLDRAAVELERALEILPGDVSATYQLAQVYAKKGETARSRELFNRVGKARADEREQFTSQGLEQISKQGIR